MIIDSSAMIAILLGEDDGERLLGAIVDAPASRISAPTLLETSIVFDGRTTAGTDGRLEALVSGFRIEIVPFSASMATLARAYRRYGGRPARLNFGDCMSYALAKCTGEPLLFKGNDFAQTDIRPALA